MNLCRDMEKISSIESLPKLAHLIGKASIKGISWRGDLIVEIAEYEESLPISAIIDAYLRSGAWKREDLPEKSAIADAYIWKKLEELLDAGEKRLQKSTLYKNIVNIESLLSTLRERGEEIGCVEEIRSRGYFFKEDIFKSIWPEGRYSAAKVHYRCTNRPYALFSPSGEMIEEAFFRIHSKTPIDTHISSCYVEQ